MNRQGPRSVFSRVSCFAVCLTAVLVLTVGTASAAVFTARVSYADSGSGVDPNLLIGTLPGVPDRSIVILRVGLAGDADLNSGPHVFQAVGAGLGFTWGAGQNSTPQYPIDYRLNPTTQVPGSPSGGRGFTYSNDLLQVGLPGQAVEIRWRGTSDWDGLFCWGTDARGGFFDDSSYQSSARVWVEYEYTGDAIPTASTPGLALLIGLIAVVGVVVLFRSRFVV